MAREQSIPGMDVGYLAEVDLEAGVGVIDGTNHNQVKLPTADGQQIKGVTVYGAKAGEEILVRRLGIANVQTSGVIARGGKVMVATTTGKFKAAAASTGVRVDVAGQAEEANASDEITGYVFLTPGAHLVGA